MLWWSSGLLLLSLFIRWGPNSQSEGKKTFDSATERRTVEKGIWSSFLKNVFLLPGEIGLDQYTLLCRFIRETYEHDKMVGRRSQVFTHMKALGYKLSVFHTNLNPWRKGYFWCGSLAYHYISDYNILSQCRTVWLGRARLRKKGIFLNKHGRNLKSDQGDNHILVMLRLKMAMQQSNFTNLHSVCLLEALVGLMLVWHCSEGKQPMVPGMKIRTYPRQVTLRSTLRW